MVLISLFLKGYFERLPYARSQCLSIWSSIDSCYRQQSLAQGRGFTYLLLLDTFQLDMVQG